MIRPLVVLLTGLALSGCASTSASHDPVDGWWRYISVSSVYHPTNVGFLYIDTGASEVVAFDVGSGATGRLWEDCLDASPFQIIGRDRDVFRLRSRADGEVNALVLRVQGRTLSLSPLGGTGRSEWERIPAAEAPTEGDVCGAS